MPEILNRLTEIDVKRVHLGDCRFLRYITGTGASPLFKASAIRAAKQGIKGDRIGVPKNYGFRVR